MQRFVKYPKTVLDCPELKKRAYRNANVLACYIIKRADHKDDCYDGINLAYGQFISTQKEIMQACDMTRQEARTAINQLERLGIISVRKIDLPEGQDSTKTVTVYGVLQMENRQITTEATTEVTTEKNLKTPTTGRFWGTRFHDVTTEATTEATNTVRNDIYYINKRKLYLLTSFVNITKEMDGFSSSVLEAFEDFAEMRQRIKKPLTENAFKRMARRLRQLADDEATQIAILHQSEDNCWLDIYPLSDKSSGKKSDTPAAGRAEAYKEIFADPAKLEV